MRYISFFLVVVLLQSCKVDPKIQVPLPSNNLVATVPAGWPQPKYNFENNPITEDRFILGRYLFYEPMLSRDNSVSCASCHQNATAFANADHDFSHGVPTVSGEEQFGVRNSPAMFNLNWHTSFMHDGGINHIELQPLGPITNPIEMDENISNVIAKLQASEKYRRLFKNAYGDEVINSQHMLKAMAQFMGLLYSYNSKFDHYKRREKKVELTEQELRGYGIFLEKCNSCHKEPLFSDFQFRSNGLSYNSNLKDSGRAHITGLEEDRFKFKTPSLRNIALTKPYMHDGRFTTLEQCLDHYTNGITNFTNLDPLLTNGIPLSAQEKSDIISFLNTLTDYEFVQDKRFGDPNFK